MDRERYQHLYERFMRVSIEVRRELGCGESREDFERELIALAVRYSGKSGDGKEKWFRNHWTVPKGVMSAFRVALGITIEIFASPLNVHFDTVAYCSAFERDKLFGSLGSAWDYVWAGGGHNVFEFNPEYESDDLKRALKWAVATAEGTDEPVVGMGVYPVWAKTAHNRVLDGTSLRIHELVTIPQKFFDFQTPDHWKGGETAYKHGSAKWDVTFFVVMNKAGAELVFDGREESMREGILEELEKLSRVYIEGAVDETFLTVGREGEVNITQEEAACVAGKEHWRFATFLDTNPYNRG